MATHKFSTKSMRNKQIYKEWSDGASKRSLALKYNVSLARITAIVDEEQYNHDNPYNAYILLSEAYPDIDPVLITATVNAVMRAKIDTLKYKRPTLDNLFKILDNCSDTELSRLKGIGIKRLEFLKRIKTDHASLVI